MTVYTECSPTVPAGRRRAARRLLALAALLAVSWGGYAAEEPTFNRTFSFKTDGKAQEQKHLWKDDSRTFVLQDRGLPCRNLDGDARFVIWRFDTRDTTAARFSVHLLNCFALSASTDGEQFQELAREEGRGGSNDGWKTADLTPFLPAKHLYVKLEHGAPEKTNGGFGACIFEVKLELSDARDTAVAQAAATPAPVNVDGVLDEPAWQHSQPLATLSDRFLTRPPARNTTFRLCYDAETWYVSAHCAQPGAKEVIVTAKGHDTATYYEDAFEVFFLPPNQDDHYHLAVNLGGFVFDELNGDGAVSWDSNAVVKVNRDTATWTLEMAVPVEAMGVEALAPGQAWRVGLFRDDMGYAQYTAWSSVVGGGWHAEDRYGQVNLVDTPNSPLPAVNVEFPGENRMGANPVKLLLQGIEDPDAFELTLDVLPVPIKRLPESDQDLDQMNPIFADLPLQEAKDGVLESTYTLDRLGVAHLVATLREKATGVAVSRAVAGARLSAREVIPIKVTLQQPYVAVETEIPFEVELNLSEEELRGAKVRTVVVDGADKSVVTLPTQDAAKALQGVLPVDELALGEYTVRVTAVDQHGNDLVSQDRPLNKHAPFGEPMKVTIGDDGLCYVNGEAKLPLGFMLAPPDKALREAGYDVALYGGETLEGRNKLDTAAENGVWGMPHICNYLRGKNDFDSIRAVVSLRKTEPALFAWYLADEPEGHGDTPEILRKAYEIIKAVDPNHPVVVLTNSPAMLPRYEGCADVIIADPYPIPEHPLSLVAEWTDIAVSAATDHGQAAWMTPQGFGWADIGQSDAPSPTREELSNMLYSCFIHGAKGILWWPYNTPRQNYWPHFRKLGRESRFFEPWLLHGVDVPGMPAGVQQDGDVHWRAWQHDGAALILAVNLARQSRAVKIPLPKGTRTVSFPFDEDLGALTPSSPGETLDLRLAPVQTLAIVVKPMAESEENEAMNRKPRTPKLTGEWIQVSYSPELPEIESAPGQVVDHCFFPAADGTWQLWTQIRDSAVGRIFYRWEGGKQLARPDWEPRGICWRADRDCGESWDTGDQDWIHAPYTMFEDGTYIMYYGGGPSENGDAQISIATSTDGITFERVTDADGKSGVFSGPGYARDAMVLRIGDEYVMYYAADIDNHGVIAARTSPRPFGAPWSDYRVVSKGGICGNDRTSQQCPYVVFLDGYYYLFKMGPSNRYETAVYRSEDPFDFGQEDEQLVTVLEASAAEVIQDGDQWFLSSLIPGYKGARICRMDWKEGS